MIKKILKWGAGLFVLLIIAGVLFGGGSDNSSSSSSSSSTKTEQKAEKPKEYMAVDIATLNSELENNAAAAQKKYKGQNVKVTGQLGTIDSDGNYISIKSGGVDFKGVHCTINKKDKAQEDYVMALQKNQQVTAYGTITDVGEIMGYKMKVDKFE